MPKEFKQEYKYITKDGKIKKAEYTSIQGEGFTGGEKKVTEINPDGSINIKREQRLSIQDPNVLNLEASPNLHLLEDKKNNKLT